MRFGGTLLRHFSAAALERLHALALPVPVADRLGAGASRSCKLQIGARTIPALLGVTLKEHESARLVHSPVALAPLAFAQELAGMTGRITSIFVRRSRTRSGSWGGERIVRLAGARSECRASGQRREAVLEGGRATNQSTALFAAISALVGFLFAFNAMLLTVPARRALIADLRLDGYSPWAIIEVLLFDALVLGVIASLAGLAIGEEISLRVFGGSPGYCRLRSRSDRRGS